MTPSEYPPAPEEFLLMVAAAMPDRRLPIQARTINICLAEAAQQTADLKSFVYQDYRPKMYIRDMIATTRSMLRVGWLRTTEELGRQPALEITQAGMDRLQGRGLLTIAQSDPIFARFVQYFRRQWEKMPSAG